MWPPVPSSLLLGVKGSESLDMSCARPTCALRPRRHLDNLDTHTWAQANVYVCGVEGAPTPTQSGVGRPLVHLKRASAWRIIPGPVHRGVSLLQVSASRDQGCWCQGVSVSGRVACPYICVVRVDNMDTVTTWSPCRPGPETRSAALQARPPQPRVPEGVLVSRRSRGVSQSVRPACVRRQHGHLDHLDTWAKFFKANVCDIAGVPTPTQSGAVPPL